MSYLGKPHIASANVEKNALGLSVHDYEGAMSTLCAGCGHDSITAAIVRAVYESNIKPEMLAKLSGIGCSSKTPGYFVSGAHGFNAVHGRMPSVATGAIAAHNGMHYLAVSGDGDTAAIGLGQFCHAIRRGLNMVYIIENNGCYGLTKGQFSATADVGAKSKSGLENELPPLDPVMMAALGGAGFIARSFAGNKSELIPLIKAGLAHNGFALIDVISPCVTFNNHSGSGKSYAETRNRMRSVQDFVPLETPIEVDAVKAQDTTSVSLHNGESMDLKQQEGGPVSTPTELMIKLEAAKQHNTTLTGLLLHKENATEFHETWKTPQKPLREFTFSELCPGKDKLNDLMNAFR